MNILTAASSCRLSAMVDMKTNLAPQSDFAPCFPVMNKLAQLVVTSR
jgi:hypothetical protein